MAFSWEFILHLELILSGREHIMGTVMLHTWDVITAHCSLADSYLQLFPGEEKKHTDMFALHSLYIWLSWDIKDIKVTGLSLSEG